MAIKIPKQCESDKTAEKVKEVAVATLDEIEREIRTHTKLSHHNVVRVHGLMLGPSKFGIVMQWCESNLEEFVEKSTSPRGAEQWSACIGYLHGAAQGLAFLHEAGILNPDIKPANILILEGQAKLTDFGLSERVQSVTKQTAYVARARAGTHRFMAPEVLLGNERATKHSDVFSFGIVVGFVATGGVPWHAVTRHPACSAVVLWTPDC